MRRNTVCFSAVVILSFLAISCERTQEKETTPPGNPTPGITQGSATGSTAGITWSVPERWTSGGDRQMRVATYMIPAWEGDTEGGECAVFYFGPAEGGDVEPNISRWASQFESVEDPERSTRNIDGITVHLMSMSGTYLASAGPMMGAGPKKEGFRLLGAIAEGPQGSVFFKMTGPEKTIDSAEAEFDQLISSIIRM